MNTSRDVVLVTGANGLLGLHTARSLVQQYTVVGAARHDPRPPVPFEVVRMDITSDDSVQSALKQIREQHGSHLASVLHFVAYYNFSGEHSPKYDQITVHGTQRLLRALHEQAFDVEQFVFSSTMLVHLPCDPGQRITEDWPLAPKWAYPESKVVTEDLIRAERGNIPIVLLRIAGVYDGLCHSIPLVHQMQRIWERNALSHLFPGDLSHGQSFIHRDDVVLAYEQVVSHRRELPPEVAILLGEPVTLSYDELQRAFGWFLHGEDWETHEFPKELAKLGSWVENGIPIHIPRVEDPFIKPFLIDIADDHYALDLTRARTLLGWEPQRTLRDTIPLMCEALKREPEAFYEENHLPITAQLEHTEGHHLTGIAPPG